MSGADDDTSGAVVAAFGAALQRLGLLDKGWSSVTAEDVVALRELVADLTRYADTAEGHIKARGGGESCG